MKILIYILIGIGIWIATLLFITINAWIMVKISNKLIEKVDGNNNE